MARPRKTMTRCAGGAHGRRLDALADLQRSLEGLSEPATSVTDWIAPRLVEVFGGGVAATYGLHVTAEHLDLQFWQVAGPRDTAPRLLRLGRECLGRAPVSRLAYDAIRPPVEQRNQALVLDHLPIQKESQEVYRRMLVPAGLGNHDQLRVLVCDGPRMLAWIGGYRDEPYSEHDTAMLQALVPALLRRLKRESMFGDADIVGAGLWAAMEAMHTPALMIDGRGYIVHMNELAAKLRQAQPQRLAFLKQLDQRPSPADFNVVPVHGHGTPTYRLVIARCHGSSSAARIEAFCRQYSLTRKQTQVFQLVAQGESNKVIALKLGCTLRTVEVHVTNILRATGCDGRTELVSRALWSD